MQIVVNYIIKYSISDISWSMYCEILYSIFQDKYLRIKFIFKYMSELFLHMINNIEVKTKGIETLKEYRNILEVDMSYKIKTFSINKEDKNSLYGYLWFNSEINHLYVYDKTNNTQSVKETKTMIININSNNKFIRELLIKFIDKNLIESKFNKMGQLEYKQFIYYFEKSLSKLGILPNDVTYFTFDTFKEQYKFYKKFNERIKINKHWNNSLSVLKEFYIFLVEYIHDNNYSHNIFLGTDIKIDELINHNFNYYYENGYTIIDKNGFSEMPKSDRWSIKSDSKVCSQSYKLIVFDFTKVKNKIYREDLKKYVWYQSKLSNTTLYGYSRHIVSFFTIKQKFDEELEDFMFRDEMLEFSLEFLMAYRIEIMLKTRNQNSRIDIFKSIRRFLLYYESKYKITKLHLKYIATKYNADVNINPVTTNDFYLLSKEFMKRSKSSTLDELYYIIFNLKSTTRLRIGEILNLERDCTDIKGENNNDLVLAVVRQNIAL